LYFVTNQIYINIQEDNLEVCYDIRIGFWREEGGEGGRGEE
jgi:hypothetical protein